MLPILLMMWAGSQDPAADDHRQRRACSAPPLALFHRLRAAPCGAVRRRHLLARGGGDARRAAPGVAAVPASTARPSACDRSPSPACRSMCVRGRTRWRVGGSPAPAGWRRAFAPRDPARRRAPRGRCRCASASAPSAAAPRSADEASLRSLGDPAFDPTRPAAQRVSSCVAQASMIDPAQLAATRLTLDDGRAGRPAPEAVSADGHRHRRRRGPVVRPGHPLGLCLAAADLGPRALAMSARPRAVLPRRPGVRVDAAGAGCARPPPAGPAFVERFRAAAASARSRRPWPTDAPCPSSTKAAHRAGRPSSREAAPALFTPIRAPLPAARRRAARGRSPVLWCSPYGFHLGPVHGQWRLIEFVADVD